MRTESLVGISLVCTETGKAFVGEAQGCSFNYATDRKGNIFSDEGVDIREKRELFDRSKPFGAYISSDGSRATGWKGNTLGHVTWRKPTRIRSVFSGKLESFNVRDVHGGYWFGRGAPGVYITLRPMKAPK